MSPVTVHSRMSQHLIGGGAHVRDPARGHGEYPPYDARPRRPYEENYAVGSEGGVSGAVHRNYAVDEVAPTVDLAAAPAARGMATS